MADGGARRLEDREVRDFVDVRDKVDGDLGSVLAPNDRNDMAFRHGPPVGASNDVAPGPIGSIRRAIISRRSIHSEEDQRRIPGPGFAS